MPDLDFLQGKSEAEIRKLLIDAVNYKLGHSGDDWVPNGAQANYIKLLGGVRGYEQDENTWVVADDPDNFISVFCTANGVGKTHLVTHVALQVLGVLNNRWFRDERGELFPFFQNPPVGGRCRIVSTPTALEKTILPMLRDIWPVDAPAPKKEGNSYYPSFYNKRGAFLDLMSYEQDVDKFASATLGVILFDEPDKTPERFIESTARFRRGGKIGITACPLNAAAWVHDMVIGNTNWRVGTVYARIWANSIERGIRGILKEEDISNMIAGWSEDEYAARALGQFMHLSGVVYKMFNRRVHVVKPQEIPRHGTIFCAMDPHDARPPFIGWFLMAEDGRIYQIAEFPSVEVSRKDQAANPRSPDGKRRLYYTDMQHDSRTIDDYVAVIKNVEAGFGRPVYRRVMDPRFGNKTYPNSGAKVWQEYVNRGVQFDLAGVDPTLARGHSKVKAMLQYNLDDTSKPFVYPRLFISENCQNTIRAFERYRFKVNPSGGAEEEVEDDKGVKDPMDVVRMVADLDYTYIDPQIINQWHQIWAEAS